MPTFDIEQLSRRIEQVIHEHLAASERAAAEAISRAFGAKGRQRTVTPPPPRGEARRRRSSAELAAVGDLLYQAVCRTPGESMAVLARALELRPQVLNRPMNQLRSKGLIRSVGQKHQTRYFPLSAKG
jgi:hypothetical protein